MKYTLIAILSLAVFASPLFADWVSLQRDAQEGAQPLVEVIVSDDNHAVLEVTLPGFFQEQDTRSNDFHISMPNCATTEKVGCSALPVVSGLLALPANTAEVNIADYQVLSSEEFNGTTVHPFQKPLTEEETAGPAVRNADHYATADSFPSECLSLGNVAIWRNNKIVRFSLVPMQVNPASATMSVHTKVRFSVNYVQGRTGVTAVSTTNEFESMYKSMILNYQPSQQVRHGGSYLVITDDKLASAIQPFVDWKQGRGYDVKLVKMGKAGKTAQDIKNFISNEYRSDLAYVMLVGDPDTLPVHMWDGRYPSDYWYGCLEGNDLYADIAVGRICAKNATEVQYYIDKMKAYEAHKSNGNDWATKVMIASHKQNAPGKYEGCVEQVVNKTYKNKVKFNTRHGSNHSNTNAKVSADINEGRGIVAYRGHGNTSVWSHWNGTNYSNNDLLDLQNTQYPVFLSIACYNSKIDSKLKTFAEACMNQPHGGSAFLGASRPSYTTPNHDFCKQLFIGVYDNGIKSVGCLSNFANVELLKKYGQTSYASANVKMYLWLGDPSLKLHIVK